MDPHAAATGLDLALAGTLYLVSSRPDGVGDTLIFLEAVSATLVLPFRAALLYVVAVMLVMVGIELVVRHPWSLDVILHDVGVRLVRIALVAYAGAILAGRLTLEQRATRRAETEAEQWAELDRLRSNFVAAVSHDLRTPLTAVRAGLGLLEASAGDHLRVDEGHLLGTVRRNVDRLGIQIDDLLLLNQLEAGRCPITAVAIDLRAVIAGAVAVAHPLTGQKGQVLEVAVDRPLLVEGDRRRLEQVLVNLVANAHHHTPSGTHITVGGRETPDGILLRVEDDGPGIPEPARTHLFERFYRADAGTAGSGLGLAVVKAIVECHGGHVWVESDVGHGTTFSVLLPRQIPKD